MAILADTIGGLAFFAVGLPAPTLWGAVMGTLSYLPIPGATQVWIPGVLYCLFFQGAYIKTAVLCTAGAVIAFVDQVVRNLLVANRVQLHPCSCFSACWAGSNCSDCWDCWQGL